MVGCVVWKKRRTPLCEGLSCGKSVDELRLKLRLSGRSGQKAESAILLYLYTFNLDLGSLLCLLALSAFPALSFPPGGPTAVPIFFRKAHDDWKVVRVTGFFETV